MGSLRTYAVGGVLLLLATATPAWAQREPHIAYVYPAGAQQGSEVQVTVGGQFMDGADKAFVSGAGVEATVEKYIKPLNNKQANDLRQELSELRKKGKSPEVAAQIQEITDKLATFIKKKANPAFAEVALVRIRVSADASPGPRELRLGAAAGLTNPLVFCIGQIPETAEEAAKLTNNKDVRRKLRYDSHSPAPTPPVDIKLPMVVNGQIMAGSIDRYRFYANRGQNLVAAVSARDLIPYLADAVPGWFQATLTLYDAQGRELAYDDDFRFHPDPVLHYRIPKDGQYVIAIKDAIYRGREDFVYRIAIGQLPFITSVFPLGGPAGAQTKVNIRGWNLGAATQLVNDNDNTLGLVSLVAHRGKIFSNRVPFAVDALPECCEQEPNNEPDAAQAVSLPIIVNGRIDAPGEEDVFRFDGRAGDELVAEVNARRLDSPLDSALALTDASGKRLACNDDHEDKGAGLDTHHADSYLRVKLPADGTYYLHLTDAQDAGGLEYAYRLRISPPQPDFALRVTPSSINVRSSPTIPLVAYALRKDGFAGPIDLALKDAPRGFTLSGARIPAGVNEVRFTLTATAPPDDRLVDLQIEGRAEIAGRTVVRRAVPAEDMMQAFAYQHLVPTQELDVAIWSSRNSKIKVQLVNESPLKIPVGGAARLHLNVPARMLSNDFEFELDRAPEGIVLQKGATQDRRLELVLQSDAAKSTAGAKGNLIIQAFSVRTPAGKGKPSKAKTRFLVATLPAVAYEIVKP